MQRVLRKDGYLFLTFPCMTDIRVYKAKRGKYRIWCDGEREPDGFYQFALSSTEVILKFRKLGFDLADQKGLDGLKGLKDEIPSLKISLQQLYDSPSFFS